MANTKYLKPFLQVYEESYKKPTFLCQLHSNDLDVVKEI